LESTVVPVSPTRVLDTRDPSNLGLPGPFVSPVSQKLQITGAIPTAAGVATVVPRGATGVLLNVTSVNPSANGFFVGDTTASQQICGATVTYTVPTGFSVLNAAPDPEPVERSQGGIPEEIPANSPAGGG